MLAVALLLMSGALTATLSSESTRLDESIVGAVPLFRPLAWTARAVRRRLSGMPWQSVQVCVEMEKVGSDYGGYSVVPDRIRPDSVVYSFGIGEDISFDLGMIERFGVTVHAFDPTPRSLAWVAGHTPPPRLVVHPFGLADHDGQASFAPPVNPEHVSHTMLDCHSASGPHIDLEVKRLSTVMQELGHDRVEILKMDIEGAEYGVIEDFIDTRIPISQILLEYHHHLPGVPLLRTERSLRRLNAAGYRIFDVSEEGREFSLIHESAVTSGSDRRGHM